MHSEQTKACSTMSISGVGAVGRDASPVEQSLNALNEQIAHAIETARELRMRVSPVSYSDSGEACGSAATPKQPAMSMVESRIENASDGLQQLLDTLRTTIHGLRI